MTGGRQRRELDPPFDLFGPALDDRRRRPGKHRIGADLVEIAVLPRRESRAERRGNDDLAFHLDDEFLDLWWPVRDGLAPHPGPVLEIVIGPNVDNFVQWPDFSVKESAERRHLGAFSQRLSEPLLGLRHRRGLQSVGPHLKNHRHHSLF